MTTLIKIPFAQSGDKTVPPATDAAGGVNWTQGYPSAYSKDPATDPSAKRIEREPFNGVLNVITTAINEVQTNGVVPFITSAENGGSPFAYGQGAVVLYNNKLYQSSKANNTDLPTVAGSWDLMITASEGSAVPVGVPLPWCTSTPPPGWIKMIGQSISAATYPKLAAVYGTTLPDMRGYFIRGFDDGRGIDPGRVIKSDQSPRVGYLSLALSTFSGAFNAGNVILTDAVSVTCQNVNGAPGLINNNSSPASGDAYVIPADTRPWNVAFSYIVRGE